VYVITVSVTVVWVFHVLTWLQFYLVGIAPVKQLAGNIVTEMTNNLSRWTLNLPYLIVETRCLVQKGAE